MFNLKLIPQNKKFYDFFEQDASNLVAAAEKLVDLFDNYVNVREKAVVIKKLEHEGDEITHRIMEDLHRSFITPMDREDITLLADRLDDMLDLIEGTTKLMFLYQIKQPTPRAIEITYVIKKVAIELAKAISLLRSNSQRKLILTHCVEIHRLENEADNLRHAALADIFEEEKDLREILKWRDIYNDLEDAVDKGEDVANVLEGIVLKNA
ncbi:MAG: DUF47 family protein [Dehalococcoidia bacterium]